MANDALCFGRWIQLGSPLRVKLKYIGGKLIILINVFLLVNQYKFQLRNKIDSYLIKIEELRYVPY